MSKTEKYYEALKEKEIMSNTEKYYEAITPFSLGLGALRAIVKAHMKQPQVVDIHAVKDAIEAFQTVSDKFVEVYNIIYPEVEVEQNKKVADAADWGAMEDSSV